MPSAQTAYCVKCQQKQPIKDSSEVKMRNGRDAIKGICSACGTGVYLIVPNKKVKV